MDIESVKFDEFGGYVVTARGNTFNVPDDMGNKDRQAVEAWKTSGGTVAPYAPPEHSRQYLEAAVRKECQRRLLELTGARDAEHLKVLISDASLEAIALLHKGAANWSNEEKQRADQLSNHREAIKSLTDASKRIRSLPEIPADFKDNKFWTEGAA